METQLKNNPIQDFKTKNGRKDKMGWGFTDIEIAAAQKTNYPNPKPCLSWQRNFWIRHRSIYYQ